MSFVGREIDLLPNSTTALVIDDSGGRMGVSVLLTNTGSAEVRLGGLDVNMSDKGFPLPALATVPVTLNGADTLQVRNGSTTGKLAYLIQDN